MIPGAALGMTYEVGQSKPEHTLSVFPVILSARHSARVRNHDMERIIILIVILSGATAQPKNLAVGAELLYFLRFARFLGKLGMTYKVGQSKPERALSVQNVILSARNAARVRNPDMKRIIDFIIRQISPESSENITHA